MPQVDGHRRRVQAPDAPPQARPGQQPGGGRLGRDNQPALRGGEGEQRDRWRVGVARAHHVRHVPPRGQQAGQQGRAARGQRVGAPPGPGQGAVLPGEAPLVYRAPYEQVAGIPEHVPVGPGHALVHQGGRGSHDGGHHQTPAPVRGEQRRGQRDQQQVNRQEPQLQGDQPAGLSQLGRAHARRRRHRGRQDPGHHEHRRRPPQPHGPVADPDGPALPLAVTRRPRLGVDITADQEEGRHDLERPGDPPSPCHVIQRVRAGQLPAGVGDGDQQPVAVDHAADGRHPQQVKVAIALHAGGTPRGDRRRPAQA